MSKEPYWNSTLRKVMPSAGLVSTATSTYLTECGHQNRLKRRHSSSKFYHNKKGLLTSTIKYHFEPVLIKLLTDTCKIIKAKLIDITNILNKHFRICKVKMLKISIFFIIGKEHCGKNLYSLV